MEEKRKTQQDSTTIPENSMPEDIVKMNLAELRQYAAKNNIPINGLRKSEDVRAQILKTLDSEPPDGEKSPPQLDTPSVNTTPPEDNPKGVGGDDPNAGTT